ncbi:GNAT family N-acetyltransferase [Gordonia oleivorans]|uniref:GNAT family N-acetyltransferase n=2 Tax=Gordonia TaxID=2053 RepID=UPI003CCCC09B
MCRLVFIWGMTSAPVTVLTGRFRTLVDAGPLRVILTDEPSAIAAAQRLRYTVFAAEPGFADTIGDYESGRDADHFDAHCEHLLAWHDDHGLIGCARLLPPPRAIAAGGWYSSGEFDLSELDEIAPATVEMGRACVLDGHRHGSVTALLWAALFRHLDETGYRYVMGSVSVPLGDTAIRIAGHPAARGSLLRGVRDVVAQRHRADWQAYPHVRARIDGVLLDEIEPPASVTMPPLMRAYLRLGAKIGGEPAVDSAFDVGDFLTVLDTRTANARYLDRLRDSVARLGGAR